MSESEYISECISMLESKSSWGTSTQWTTYHFSKLSQEIQVKTGKTISDSTLKRFFGRKDTKETYSPQMYTKDAIAEFLGYKDWEQLVIYLKNRVGDGKQPIHRLSRSGIIVGLVLIIGLVLFFLVRVFVSSGEVSLTCKDSCKVVPYTATFHYNISGIRDCVFIDFGNKTRVYLPKNRNTINEFYKQSGIFYPKIFTNNEELDSVRIINYSDGWQGGISPNDDPRQFVPFQDQSVWKQYGCMHAPIERIKLTDPVYVNGFYTEYRLLKDFKMDLDQMEFQTTVKNPANEGGKLCYDIEILLAGTLGNVKIRFVQPDCFRYGQVQVSEKIYNGRYDDLSAFARNMSDWRQISIQTGKNEVFVLFNGQEIFHEEYNKPMGKLIGVNYRFYGTGSVKQAKVINRSGFVMYEDNFTGN